MKKELTYESVLELMERQSILFNKNPPLGGIYRSLTTESSYGRLSVDFICAFFISGGF